MVALLHKFPNGWWVGEVNQKQGIFPSTYVREMTTEETAVTAPQPTQAVSPVDTQPSSAAQQPVATSGALVSQQPQPQQQQQQAQVQPQQAIELQEPVRAVVLHSYQAQEAGEVSLAAGTAVMVEMKDPSGWWYVRGATGADQEIAGIFPSNFLREIPKPPPRAQRDAALLSSSGGAPPLSPSTGSSGTAAPSPVQVPPASDSTVDALVVQPFEARNYTELTLVPGATVRVTSKNPAASPAGFWEGVALSSGLSGLFPAANVREKPRPPPDVALLRAGAAATAGAAGTGAQAPPSQPAAGTPPPRPPPPTSSPAVQRMTDGQSSPMVASSPLVSRPIPKVPIQAARPLPQAPIAKNKRPPPIPQTTPRPTTPARKPIPPAPGKQAQTAASPQPSPKALPKVPVGATAVPTSALTPKKEIPKPPGKEAGAASPMPSPTRKLPSASADASPVAAVRAEAVEAKPTPAAPLTVAKEPSPPSPAATEAAATTAPAPADDGAGVKGKFSASSLLRIVSRKDKEPKTKEPKIKEVKSKEPKASKEAKPPKEHKSKNKEHKSAKEPAVKELAAVVAADLEAGDKKTRGSSRKQKPTKSKSKADLDQMPSRELPPNPVASAAAAAAAGGAAVAATSAPPPLPPRGAAASAEADTSMTPQPAGAGQTFDTFEGFSIEIPASEAPEPPPELLRELLDDAAGRAPPPPPPSSFTKNLMSLFRSASSSPVPEETGSKHPLQKRNLMQPVNTPFVAGVCSPSIYRDSLCIDWEYGTPTRERETGTNWCAPHSLSQSLLPVGRRAKVLNEILATEESYVRGLELLKSVRCASATPLECYKMMVLIARLFSRRHTRTLWRELYRRGSPSFENTRYDESLGSSH